MKCRKWVLRSHFSGLPKREDLEIVEEELPPLKDGGMHVVTCLFPLYFILRPGHPMISDA